MRDRFAGIGKPELLKYLGPNVWSRRFTAEHRIVYLVRDDRIDFLRGATTTSRRPVAPPSRRAPLTLLVT